MKNKIIILILILVFLVGVAFSALSLLSHEKNTVNIVRDGEVLYTFDLSKTKDQVFDIEYNGSVNTIEIKDGKIRVKDAQCPDKTCVHTGWLSSSAMPIVCLPNHLVIEFADDGVKVDALSR